MLKLEQLQNNAAIGGIVPDTLVTVVNVQWFGSEALELTYKTASGKVANELLYRHDEPRLELVEQGRPWSFDGDGALFRLSAGQRQWRSGLQSITTWHFQMDTTCTTSMFIRCYENKGLRGLNQRKAMLEWHMKLICRNLQ